MPIVSCPNCGKTGTVPDQFLGKRIRCKVCASEFLAAQGSGKANPVQTARQSDSVGTESPGWKPLDGYDPCGRLFAWLPKFPGSVGLRKALPEVTGVRSAANEDDTSNECIDFKFAGFSF